jgi:hypothetical protein
LEAGKLAFKIGRQILLHCPKRLFGYVMVIQQPFTSQRELSCAGGLSLKATGCFFQDGGQVVHARCQQWFLSGGAGNAACSLTSAATWSQNRLAVNFCQPVTRGLRIDRCSSRLYLQL